MSAEENDKIESGFNKLVNEVKGTLNHQLKDIYSSFLESADTALFDLANEAGSNDEQKQYAHAGVDDLGGDVAYRSPLMPHRDDKRAEVMHGAHED